MSAPLRIRQPAVKGARGDEGLKSYLDRLLKLIPAEVLSIYVVGAGLIPGGERPAAFGWAVVCLFLVGFVKWFGTSDRLRDIGPDWVHVLLSMAAFLIWLYSMGGPFDYIGLKKSYIGSLLILGFTFAVPYVYRGQSDPGNTGK